MRHFNTAEDLLIREQAEGKHILTRLLRVLHASREAFDRRAFELGVIPHVQRRRRRSMRQSIYARREELQRRKLEEKNGKAANLIDRGNPVKVYYHGHEDGLLEALRLFHCNRRYESLKFHS